MADPIRHCRTRLCELAGVIEGIDDAVDHTKRQRFALMCISELRKLLNEVEKENENLDS